MDGSHALPAARSQVDVTKLYRQHWLPLTRLAVLLTSDTVAAEDVVQEAFVALYRNQHRLRDSGAAVAYVRAAVVNLTRTALRRRATARRHLPRALEPDAPPADDRLLLTEDHREVLAALRTLPPRQREVLVLRYWSGLTEAQIADALGISAGTVKSSTSRALEALRARMGGAAR